MIVSIVSFWNSSFRIKGPIYYTYLQRIFTLYIYFSFHVFHVICFKFGFGFGFGFTNLILFTSSQDNFSVWESKIFQF